MSTRVDKENRSGGAGDLMCSNTELRDIVERRIRKANLYHVQAKAQSTPATLS